MAKERRDEKNLIVLRGQFCFAVMNLFPYNSGHVMVVPYRHTSKLERLNEHEYAEILKMTAQLERGLRKISDPHGFNFGANFGRVAGAGIDKHLHFHLVPRWNGDTNFLPVLAETKMISEDIRKTWRELRKAVAKERRL